MADKANLLVTFDPAHDAKAKEEVEGLLGIVKDKPKFLKSKIAGLFLLKVKDARKAVKALRAAATEEPDQFAFTYHWIPIDEWVSSDLKVLKKKMKEFDKKIDPKKTWKLSLAKRQYEAYKTPELILALTEEIDKPKVDLKNPQQLVKVEIIGKEAGLSLLDAHETLDVAEIKHGHERVH
jgi:tRNA(Ser,Leu) C12 N-acetylase TAN1